MMHVQRTRMLLMAGALTIGLLASGCSDDGEKSVQSNDTDQTTKPEKSDPSDGAAPAEGDQEISIADYAYDPDTLTVKVGATVTWTNEDDFDHTATASDGPGELDTGDLGKGDSGEVTLDEAGTYDYICSIHNYMKGSVEVVE